MSSFRTLAVESIMVSGTRKGMSDQQRKKFVDIQVEFFSKAKTFLHGDCTGVDQQAHLIVREMNPEITIHIYQPSNNRNSANCAASDPSSDLLVVHPPEDFKKRDRKMVDASNLVIAFPFSQKEQVRSGTWVVIRYAKKRNTPLMIIYPDGQVVCSGKW